MSVSTDHANETWVEIQRAVESLSTLARQQVSPDHFYGALTRSLCDLTSGTHCAVWRRETRGKDGDDTSPDSDAPEVRWEVLKEFLPDQRREKSIVRQRGTRTYERAIARASESATETCLSAGETLQGKPVVSLRNDITLQRVVVDDVPAAVIELVQGPERSPSQREAATHLTTVAAEIASDFQRNWQLRQLRDREQRGARLERFLDRIHRSYELRRVGHAVVAEGKELIDCDRLSIVLKKGRRCRVLAVSGVHKPDRRSPTVQSIERLVKSRIREQEPVWLKPDQSNESAGKPVTKYFGETKAKYVGLIPLVSAGEKRHKPERLGTLLVESFEETASAADGLLEARADWLVKHASNAVGNSVRVNRLPMLGVSRWIDRHVTRGRRIPWKLLLTAAVLTLVWFVAWMPTDFRIHARGELVPVHRESIYAPKPGTVIDFPLMDDGTRRREDSQGTSVEPGDVVVQLENAELDYELTTLLGEQSTVNQQLETITTSIGQFGRARDEESRSRYDELTSQAAELRVKQASLARRIRLINKERERLSVKANIRGRVLTWDFVNSLMLRPVQQGDRLLEVVDVEGPWEVDLFVRDRHIGYIKRAQEEQSGPLSISFFHRSDPEREYAGTIKSVALSTEIYPEYGSAVRVIGKIDGADQLHSLRPGTTVIAKVDCGKKPLAYVLGYDLVHTIRLWMLF